jgi:hypothetical protein
MKTFIALLLISNSAFAVSLVAPDGTYLGELSSNPYAQNSTSNQFGPYGSKFSPTSINNEFGVYGSRFSQQSPNNPYGGYGEPPSHDEVDPNMPVPPGMIPE